MANRRITEERRRGYAQAMREHPTDAEHALQQAFWRNHVRPRRQAILNGYIVDFYFARARLIVEVDGYWHFTSKGRSADRVRTRVLSSRGYTIIRFPNGQVLADPDRCARRVIQHLDRTA